MARYWVATALFLTMSPATAAQLVCGAENYAGDRTADPLNISTSLSENSKAYPIHANSAYSEAYGRNLICFQYEIVNSGNETIPLVFWNLVDDYRAKDLSGQESRFRNRTRPTKYDGPIKAPTKIKGLRSAEILAQAWQTVEDANKTKELIAVRDPVFSFTKASSLDPTVANAVKSGFLLDDDVAVMDYKVAAQGQVGPVSDAVGSGDGLVVSRSAIALKEKTLLANFLRVKIPPGSQVKIFSPFLSALMKEPTKTAQFLEGIYRYTKEPTPLVATSNSKEEQFPFITYDSAQKIYVVEHPITIEWQTRDSIGSLKSSSVQCVRIASYSPFPVPLNGRFCVR
jgi:hypothetical protein